MKKILKWFLISVLIGFTLGVIIYFYIKYLLIYTIPIGFFLYFIIGILIQSHGLITLFKSIKNQKRLGEIIMESFPKKKKSLINRIKFLINSFLSNLLSVVIWPISIYFILSKTFVLIGRSSAKKMVFEFDLKVTDHIIGIVLIFTLGICYLFKILNLDDFGYGLAMLYILIFAFISKHLIYILELNGLPAKLRKRVKRPFNFFLIILIIDFIGIVLTISFLESIIKEQAISKEIVYNTVISFVDFKEQTKQLFFNENLVFFEIIKVLSIWLFYYSFISHVFKFNSFKKSNEDILWLMTRNNSLGKFNKNIRLVNNLKNKTESIFKAEVISLLGVNNIEGAKRIMLKLNSELYLSNEQQIYEEFLPLLLTYEFNLDVVNEIVKDSIMVAVSDMKICGILRAIANDYEIESYLINIFKNLEKDYPLTLIELYISDSQIEQAIVAINRNIKLTNQNSDKIIMCKQYYECELNYIENKIELTEFINNWTENNLEEFENLISQVENNNELLVIYDHFVFINASINASNYTNKQKIDRIGENIKTLIPKDELVEKIIIAIDDRKEKVEIIFSDLFR